MSYVKKLNKMTWSFSRLHAYEQCPYSFYLQYIEERDAESNFYAENGKCMHETFEAVFSQKIPIEECTEFYISNMELVCETERQSVMNNTIEKCLEYLCEMRGVDTDKYEILGVEMKLEFHVEKYKFVGIADLVILDKSRGMLVLVDHKQAPHFMKKDGTPLKNQLENFISYRNQMYLYCIGLKEQYGLDVDKIVWHHFKDDGQLTIIPYSQEECDNTKEWALNLIEKIKKDKRFDSKESYIMCNSLCNFRNDCEYKELTD